MATATPGAPPCRARCLLLCAIAIMSAACSDLPTANDSGSTARFGAFADLGKPMR